MWPHVNWSLAESKSGTEFRQPEPSYSKARLLGAGGGIAAAVAIAVSQIWTIGGIATVPTTSLASTNLHSIVRFTPSGVAKIEATAKMAEVPGVAHPSGTTRARATVTAPAAPGLSSLNWAGYVLTGGSYQEVSAAWTVPTLDCSVVPNGSTSDWVGIDGWVHPASLFQAGTSSTCVGGSQANSAVWSDGALDYVWQDEFPANAGDVISARVVQTSSGTWSATVTDETTGQSADASEAVAHVGASAEWVTEDPGTQGSRALTPLADFGSVSFTGLSVSPSGRPPFGDQVEMLRANGSIAAMPTPMRGAGSSTSFSVTYEP